MKFTYNTAFLRIIMTSIVGLVILGGPLSMFAQTAINNSNSPAHPAAVLDISSTQKGLLIPRMSALERAQIIAPANGLLVYQTDAPSGLYFFQDNIWSPINRSASSTPIGSIIDWWRPNANFSIPAGYVICDGTAINDVLSPLNGNLTPDFTDKYVLGTSNPEEAGQSGGSAAHLHSLSATINSVSSFNHTHAFNYSFTLVSNEGNHSHTTIGQTGTLFDRNNHNHEVASYDQGNKIWSSRNASGNLVEIIDWGDGIDAGGTGHFPIQTNGFSGIIITDTKLSHAHTFTIPAGLVSTTSGAHSHTPTLGTRNTALAGAHSHEYSMGTVSSNAGSNHPKYTGLLKLMRIY